MSYEVGNKCCLVCRQDHGNNTHDEIVTLIRSELCLKPGECAPDQPQPSRCKSCGHTFSNGGSLMRHEDPPIECINKMEQRVYAKVQKQERLRYEMLLEKERQKYGGLLLAAKEALEKYDTT